MKLYCRVANNLRGAFEFPLLAPSIVAFFRNIYESIRNFDCLLPSVRIKDCVHKAWDSQEISFLSPIMEVAHLMFLRSCHNSLQHFTFVRACFNWNFNICNPKYQVWMKQIWFWCWEWINDLLPINWPNQMKQCYIAHFYEELKQARSSFVSGTFTSFSAIAGTQKIWDCLSAHMIPLPFCMTASSLFLKF